MVPRPHPNQAQEGERALPCRGRRPEEGERPFECRGRASQADPARRGQPEIRGVRGQEAARGPPGPPREGTPRPTYAEGGNIIDFYRISKNSVGATVRGGRGNVGGLEISMKSRRGVRDLRGRNLGDLNRNP